MLCFNETNLIILSLVLNMCRLGLCFDGFIENGLKWRIY